MSDSPPPAWEGAFLKALAETGIAARAAEAVGIGVRAAYKRKKSNPTFAAAWDAACQLHRTEQGRRAMSAAGELVLNRRQGGQAARAGQTRWSRHGEETFLTELAVTANVKRAAAAAGFTPSGLYARRRKDPRFAGAWQAAVDAGQARLELFLLEAADRTFDPDSIADDAEVPKMTIAEAIKVLQLAQGKSGRRPRGGSEPSGRGWTGPDDWDDPDDAEAVAQAHENIVNRLQRLRERDEEEKLAAGWTRDGENWIPPGYERRAEPSAGGGQGPAGPEDEGSGPRIRGL